MARCGTPEECGPVPCNGFLITACCPCVRHPDCDIGDDDNDGDPYCPAECLTGGFTEPPIDNGWTDGGGGTAIDSGGFDDPPPPPPPGPIDPNPVNPAPPPQCACKLEDFPTITGTEYGGSFGDPENCRRVTAVWKQECKQHGQGGPPPPPQSHTQLLLQHRDSAGFRHNDLDMRRGCRDSNAQPDEPGCTDPDNKCVPIVMSWLECLDEGDFEEEDNGGGGGGNQSAPPRGPFTPGGGYWWLCGNTQGVWGCYRTNIVGPNQTKYATRAACEAQCKPDLGGPRRPITPGPGTGGGPRWRCTDTGGVKYCAKIVHHVPGNISYPSKAACEAACLDDENEIITPTPGVPFNPGEIIEVPTGETGGNGDGTFLGGDFTAAPGVVVSPDTLGPTDFSLDPYDDLHNLRITNAALFNESATLASTAPGLDPYNMFIPLLSNILKTLLESQGTSNFIPYNGTTISGFVYNRSIILEHLSEDTRHLLSQLNQSNMVSLNLSQMMLTALKRATYTDKYKEYTPQLLEEMVSSTALLKVPIPRLNNQAYPVTNRSVGLERARISRYSMYPKNHRASGDMQRKAQMYYMPPTDYDLKVPVYTREGTITGVRVGVNSKVPVVARSSQDGSVSGYDVNIKEVNDYLPIHRRSGDVSIQLKSRRSLAMAFNMPDLSLIQGYLKSGNESTTDDLKYSFTLDASTSYADNIEVSGADTLLGAYLVTLDHDSITEVPDDNVNFRTTTCTYSSVWQEDDNPKLFDIAVSAHSGPRNTVYVDVDDPWWMHFQKTKTVIATYTDLDIDGLDGYLYPRRINTDMLIVPVTKVKYNPFQGESTLEKYNTEGTIRRLKVTVSPLKEVFSENYASPVKKADGKSWGNYYDTWAFRYSKNFDVEATQLKVMGTTVKQLSKKSMLGEFISQVNTIKDRYNLERGDGTLGLPKADLFSFYTVDQMVKFLYTIPKDIQSNIFGGVYNEVKLFDVKISDTEKSYLTSTRLISGKKSLESSRLYTTVPQLDSRYFPDKYEGLLFKYASRT